MFSNVNNPISAAVTVLVPQKGEPREAICSYMLDQDATRYIHCIAESKPLAGGRWYQRVGGEASSGDA